jgi:hypothetical protein
VALQDMMAELRGAIPKLPFAFTKTLINRAWKEVREASLWSFNLLEFSWPTPPPINAGTVIVTQGSATITFDTIVAVPAIIAGMTSYSAITARQFRVSSTGGIYNIISLDPSFASNGIATLDRIFGDQSASGTSYQIYQLYYTPPVLDFLGLYTVRNPAMYLNLDLTKTRSWIDARDPQRSWYQFPTHVVAWGRDIRGQGTTTPSATLGYPLYELWGQPVTFFTYQVYGIRRGADLVNPTDMLPFSVGEDLVLAKAYYYAYEWAEANKDQAPRSQGPDFRYLMGAREELYRKLLIMYRKQDRELTNNYFSVRDPDLSAHAYGYYNTLAGTAGPYAQL